VHEIDVPLSLGKLVPPGRLQYFLYRHCTTDFVQPVQDMWNVVIKSKYLPRRPSNDLMHT
jgi:hypothetical protein